MSLLRSTDRSSVVSSSLDASRPSGPSRTIHASPTRLWLLLTVLAACGTRSELASTLDGSSLGGTSSGVSGAAGVAGASGTSGATFGASGAAGDVSPIGGTAGTAGSVSGTAGAGGFPACFGQTCNPGPSGDSCCNGAPFCVNLSASEKPICTTTCSGGPGDCPVGSCCSFQGELGYCIPASFGMCLPGVGGASSVGGSAGAAGGIGGGPGTGGDVSTGGGPAGFSGTAGATDACSGCLVGVLQTGQSCGDQVQSCLQADGCFQLLNCAQSTGCLGQPMPFQCATQSGCDNPGQQARKAARELVRCAECEAGCGNVCPLPPNGCGMGPGQGGAAGGPGMGGNSGQAGSAGFPDCDSCVGDPGTAEACQDTINNCFADPQCNGLLTCFQNCSDDACYQMCLSQFPGGLPLYNKAVDCYYCTECSSVCSQENPGLCQSSHP